MENAESTKKVIKQDINLQKVNCGPFITFIVFIVIMLGFVTGVLYIYFGGNRSLDIINEWFEMVIQKKLDASMLNLFLTNINSIIIYILVIFLLGFSPVFSFIITLIPFIKGLGVGLSISYIYISYGWRGILYELLIDIPKNIIMIMIIILMTKESIKFSNGIYNVIKYKKIDGLSVKRYIVKFIVISLLVLIVSCLSGLCDFVFFKCFNIL